MEGVPSWVDGQSFFLLWRKRLKFLAKLPLFFQKKFAKTPPYFCVACRQLWRNLYEFVWGIDTSPVLLQYKKWPNKKKNEKRLVMGVTHGSFSSHRHRSSGACLK
jgi:hypothetical protein